MDTYRTTSNLFSGKNAPMTMEVIFHNGATAAFLLTKSGGYVASPFNAKGEPCRHNLEIRPSGRVVGRNALTHIVGTKMTRVIRNEVIDELLAQVRGALALYARRPPIDISRDLEQQEAALTALSGYPAFYAGEGDFSDHKMGYALLGIPEVAVRTAEEAGFRFDVSTENILLVNGLSESFAVAEEGDWGDGSSRVAALANLSSGVCSVLRARGARLVFSADAQRASTN